MFIHVNWLLFIYFYFILSLFLSTIIIVINRPPSSITFIACCHKALKSSIIFVCICVAVCLFFMKSIETSPPYWTILWSICFLSSIWWLIYFIINKLSFIKIIGWTSKLGISKLVSGPVVLFLFSSIVHARHSVSVKPFHQSVRA